MSEYIAEVVQNQYGEATILKEKLTRCKDCIYARMTINGDSAKYCLAWQGEDALMDSLYLPADFYCGFAERKEK